MPTTCASCRAEVGGEVACPRCGTVVLSPQTATGDWRSDTAERARPREPVVPAPATTTPMPARYPLYADELDVVGHAGQGPDAPAHRPSPASWPHQVDDAGLERDDGRRGRVGAWVAWALVALVLVLVAVSGVWLLFSPGAESSDPPAQSRSAPPVSDATNGQAPSSDGAASDQPASEPDFSGDPVDVAALAAASAPSTAPPNADAFGNRTTYDASNMLDGRPDTCWRTAGDGTGLELTFRLASPTLVSRVGLINGYAKNAVVGGRNLNWYAGNRRVLSAQWVFDDGTTVDQPLVATEQLQTVDLGDHVVTSTVTLRLVAVSSPGTGRSGRDYTAVSEVALVGVPSG